MWTRPARFWTPSSQRRAARIQTRLAKLESGELGSDRFVAFARRRGGFHGLFLPCLARRPPVRAEAPERNPHGPLEGLLPSRLVAETPLRTGSGTPRQPRKLLPPGLR